MMDDFSKLFRVTVELKGEKRLSASDLFDLLENILIYGSISRSASEQGVSYRYAWGLIRSAEKTLGLKLVYRQAGGHAGGGTSLTGEGRILLEQYALFKQEMDTQLLRFVGRAALAGRMPPSERTAGVETSERHLLLASTMEPAETGLLDVLEQAFFQSFGILVRHIALGSGRALQIAKKGRIDLTLTHAPELEAEFVRDGWGKTRHPVMSNDFLVVGPAADPAGLRVSSGTGSAKEAFKKIALSRAPFISRGDRSGTHLRELSLWESAGVSSEGEWYMVSPGIVGNTGALRVAVERQAYVFIDRAAFLLSGVGEKMEVFCDREQESALSEELENIFSMIVLNPVKMPAINEEDAALFARWIREEEARNIIANFGRESFGRPLFSIPEPSSSGGI